ncbi:MAG: hypothetical protein HY747_11290 [Elusimicrobia bacterium]|nr:hypothetical protein [Elusimicrobiota bacterium]
MRKILLSILFFAAGPVCAMGWGADDADLASPVAVKEIEGRLAREGRLENNIRVFPAQQTASAAVARPAGEELKSISGLFELTNAKGELFAARFAKVFLVGSNGVLAESGVDAQGGWSVAPPANYTGTAVIRLSLDNNFWKFSSRSGESYQWEGLTAALPLETGLDAGTFRLNPESANGQAGYIHLSFLEALALFEKNEIGIDWWQRVGVVWPGSGDYYQPWSHSVNLTNAKAWDVNLHELGHSIVYAATNSRPGGGQHKIDECYNADLAWSEGFPTFFAAAAHLDPGDPDAKFEYLVPRRAPIRLENVPEDVCPGDTNEWRVAAALWDIADVHEDGADRLGIGFARLWNSLAAKDIVGLKGAWELIKAGLMPEETIIAEAVLKQNTIDYSSALAKRQARKNLGDIFSIADWDGK